MPTNAVLAEPLAAVKSVFGLEHQIYALRSRMTPNTMPPSDPPNFGNSQLTYDLMWYRHNGYADGSATWDGPSQVGNDWDFGAIIPGSNGAIYAAGTHGDLYRYVHLGRTSGKPRWKNPQRQLIGRGFRISSTDPRPQDFLGIFCDTRNGDPALVSEALSGDVIYAVCSDGALLWYRFDGVDKSGKPVWANGGQPKKVGNGWVAGHLRVFSGCNGIIYLIANDGTLNWYRHKGAVDGTHAWIGPVAVGKGWNGFHEVFSIGHGIIYALDDNGDLWWYEHKGFRNGAAEWSHRRKVRGNWNDIPVCNSVYLKATFIH